MFHSATIKGGRKTPRREKNRGRVNRGTYQGDIIPAWVTISGEQRTGARNRKENQTS